MTGTDGRRPAALWLLMITILFQAFSGIGGGIGLLIDPSGSTIGIPQEWLQGSVFQNYLVPGLILFIVLGVGPLFVLIGLWKTRRWGWTGSVLLGVALIIWIAVEILVIGYQADPPLQAIYGAVGVLILILSFLPATSSEFKGSA